MKNNSINEEKKCFLNRFLEDSLRCFSDKAFQERIWVKGIGPEVDCYAEAICNFIPFIEELIDNYEEYNLTENQKNLLEKLYKKIDEYDDYASDNDAEIVYDPKWDEIRKFAKEVYDKLKEEVK